MDHSREWKQNANVNCGERIFDFRIMWVVFTKLLWTFQGDKMSFFISSLSWHKTHLKTNHQFSHWLWSCQSHTLLLFYYFFIRVTQSGQTFWLVGHNGFEHLKQGPKQWLDGVFGEKSHKRKKYIMGYVKNMCFYRNWNFFSLSLLKWLLKILKSGYNFVA